MIMAEIGDTPYNIVLLLHILAALVAFAPAFVHPLLGEQSKDLGESGRATVFGWMVANGRRIYAPAFILVGLLGFALSGMSDGAIELSDGWMIAAIVLWIVMNGVLHAVVVPAERAVSHGDHRADSRVQAGGMALTLMLVVMLYLMVFQPGA